MHLSLGYDRIGLHEEAEFFVEADQRYVPCHGCTSRRLAPTSFVGYDQHVFSNHAFIGRMVD